MTTTTWDQPAWDLIAAADPGLPTVIAALQATTAACDAAIGLGDPTAAIDPFTGWATTRGVLAGLLLATGQPARLDPPPLDPPPSHDAAAAVVDRLYRTTADQVLALVDHLRDQLAAVDWDQRDQLTTHPGLPARQLLRALTGAGVELAASYTETFTRPW